MLALKVFEQRYLDMTKSCLGEGLPFGVCLIREGREVGAAAVPEPVGCLAEIVHWEMPELGLFHLLVRGTGRFRICETRVAPNQLVVARIEPVAPDPPGAPVDPACRALLAAWVEQFGAARLPSPPRLDDASWVGYRLAELLPLEPRLRQQLLELTDAAERLARLKRILIARGWAA